MLSLYAGGLKINEIAQKLFITADTVKFHQKNSLKKLK
ncbi:LuxR C-terminal-related transcriptional regulator [Chryseobacterium sp. C-71]